MYRGNTWSQGKQEIPGELEGKLWNASKTVLTGKLIALNAYITKEERSKINNLSFYFRKLEKRKAN